MNAYSRKKPERNYHQCHAAMLGALMAIHEVPGRCRARSGFAKQNY